MGPFSWVGQVVATRRALTCSAGAFLLDSVSVNQILLVSVAQPGLPMQGQGGFLKPNHTRRSMQQAVWGHSIP